MPLDMKFESEGRSYSLHMSSELLALVLVLIGVTFATLFAAGVHKYQQHHPAPLVQTSK